MAATGKNGDDGSTDAEQDMDATSSGNGDYLAPVEATHKRSSANEMDLGGADAQAADEDETSHVSMLKRMRITDDNVAASQHPCKNSPAKRPASILRNSRMQRHSEGSSSYCIECHPSALLSGYLRKQTEREVELAIAGNLERPQQASGVLCSAALAPSGSPPFAPDEAELQSGHVQHHCHPATTGMSSAPPFFFNTGSGGLEGSNERQMVTTTWPGKSQEIFRFCAPHGHVTSTSNMASGLDTTNSFMNTGLGRENNSNSAASDNMDENTGSGSDSANSANNSASQLFSNVDKHKFGVLYSPPPRRHSDKPNNIPAHTSNTNSAAEDNSSSGDRQGVPNGGYVRHVHFSPPAAAGFSPVSGSASAGPVTPVRRSSLRTLDTHYVHAGVRAQHIHAHAHAHVHTCTRPHGYSSHATTSLSPPLTSTDAAQVPHGAAPGLGPPWTLPPAVSLTSPGGGNISGANSTPLEHSNAATALQSQGAFALTSSSQGIFIGGNLNPSANGTTAGPSVNLQQPGSFVVPPEAWTSPAKGAGSGVGGGHYKSSPRNKKRVRFSMEMTAVHPADDIDRCACV